MNLNDKIKNKITEYIGFNIDEIINENIDMVYIFGGAIRDIIADKKIHDIDILCLPKSMNQLITILKKHGYYQHESLSLRDIQNLYSNIKVIVEPLTFIKVINNKIRIIQLIRPSINIVKTTNYKESLFYNFYYLLGQVDLSNCAVHYSYINKLKESYFGAIEHCKNKIFEILDTDMNTDRTYQRIDKFEKRGWKNITYMDKKQYERIKKINKIISINDDYKQNYYLPPPGHPIKVIKHNNDLLFFS